MLRPWPLSTWPTAASRVQSARTGPGRASGRARGTPAGSPSRRPGPPAAAAALRLPPRPGAARAAGRARVRARADRWASSAWLGADQLVDPVGPGRDVVGRQQRGADPRRAGRRGCWAVCAARSLAVSRRRASAPATSRWARHDPQGQVLGRLRGQQRGVDPELAAVHVDRADPLGPLVLGRLDGRRCWRATESSRRMPAETCCCSPFSAASYAAAPGPAGPGARSTSAALRCACAPGPWRCALGLRRRRGRRGRRAARRTRAHRGERAEPAQDRAHDRCRPDRGRALTRGTRAGVDRLPRCPSGRSSPSSWRGWRPARSTPSSGSGLADHLPDAAGLRLPRGRGEHLQQHRRWCSAGSAARWGYRAELAGQGRRIRLLAPASLLGSVTGRAAAAVAAGRRVQGDRAGADRHRSGAGRSRSRGCSRRWPDAASG